HVDGACIVASAGRTDDGGLPNEHAIVISSGLIGSAGSEDLDGAGSAGLDLAGVDIDGQEVAGKGEPPCIGVNSNRAIHGLNCGPRQQDLGLASQVEFSGPGCREVT